MTVTDYCILGLAYLAFSLSGMMLFDADHED